MKQLNIKNKLRFMILVIFIPMIINQAFQVYNLFQKDVEVELESNQDFAEAVSVSFTNYLQRIWDTEFSMGLAINNNKIMKADDIGQYMKKVLEDQPTLRQYAWVNPATSIIEASSNKEAIGVSLAGREYINRILKGENNTVSDMITSRINNTPTFVVAKAIRIDGILKGIVTATINVNQIGSVMPSSRATDYSFFGLIDSKGIFVYRSGIPNVASKMISAIDSPVVTSALKGKTVRTREYTSHVTGETMMGVNLPVQNIGWIAYANTSHSEFQARTFMDIWDHLLVMLIIILVGLFFSIRISRQILQPINILHASALEMSNGNLNVRTNIEGTDEISCAAQAFDEMAASIEQYDTLKTQFFSNISHELKTPLNIILSSIQLIESKHPYRENCEVYRDVNKYITMMRKNCYRLLRLINNLIDITRVDSGFLKFNFGNYNIVSVVEDITLSVADFAESKGIKVTFDTETEEKMIACDPDKIERIMLNLLSNSIKFTPAGGSIFVDIFNREGKLTITVRDTGIGIPEDKIPVIFERFRQVDSSLQREYEGSGIGLSLVQALVEAHKGNIYVNSKLGQGTEVTIELPNLLACEEDINLQGDLQKQNIDRVHKINIEFSDIYS